MVTVGMAPVTGSFLLQEIKVNIAVTAIRNASDVTILVGFIVEVDLLICKKRVDMTYQPFNININTLSYVIS